MDGDQVWEYTNMLKVNGPANCLPDVKSAPVSEAPARPPPPIRRVLEPAFTNGADTREEAVVVGVEVEETHQLEINRHDIVRDIAGEIVGAVASDNTRLPGVETELLVV